MEEEAGGRACKGYPLYPFPPERELKAAGGTQPGSEGLWGLLIISISFNTSRRANTSSSATKWSFNFIHILAHKVTVTQGVTGERLQTEPPSDLRPGGADPSPSQGLVGDSRRGGLRNAAAL